MIHAISMERLMAFGLKAREVELRSEERVGDRHSTVIKRETIVIAEVMGIRKRHIIEAIHLRGHEWNNFCTMCGKPATVWFDSKERWARHPARCLMEG